MLRGHIRLEREIGRGGMGTVFRGWDEVLARHVAVKFLLPEHQADPYVVKLFRREARAMASVGHPNVLQVLDFGQFGSSDFIVTEFIEGHGLDHLLDVAWDRKDPIPLERAWSFTRQLLRGLDAVHRAGVVHRDVKPGNVMLDEVQDRIVLMDFGLGRKYDGRSNKLTLVNSGTPAYMAPELIQSEARNPVIDRSADLYAAGLCAYEIFCGRHPFTSESWVSILDDHLSTPPPRPSDLRPEIPFELDRLLLWPLSKDPADRPRSAGELSEAYEQMGHVRPAAATPAPEIIDLPAVRPPAPAEGERVFVLADADPEALAHLTRLVSGVEPGAKIKTTNSARTAFDLARRSGADVLVAPGDDEDFNGAALAASVRSEPRLRGAGLILTLLHPKAEERRAFERMGAALVLDRPLLAPEPTAGLRALLDRGEPVDRAAPTVQCLDCDRPEGAAP